MIKQYLIAAAAVLTLALSASAQLITYVDVTDGPSGNTKQIATNGTAPWNGTLTAWTSLASGGANNDSLWLKRAFGNSATIYENAGNAAFETNSTRLVTSITVPATGPGQYYNVYGLFWTDTSQTWELGALLTNYPGPLPLYQLSTPGVTVLNNDGFASTATINSTSLNPNPFTTSVMISEGNRRLLMTPVLGQVAGTNITVYTEGDRIQGGGQFRTWVDGIGYQLVTNQIITPIVLTNGVLIINYVGSAGRQYLCQEADDLTPPVTWTPMQTGTANSSGKVSFTNILTSSQGFYRVQDITPAPSAVTNLVAIADTNRVFLSWSRSTGATSYNIKEAVTSGGPYTTIANTSTTNYVANGLVNGTTYYFVVSALNFNGEGSDSSQANATPFPPQPPSAPAGLAAMAGNTLVQLNWNPSVSAISYNVRSGATSGGPYTATNNVTTTSFINNGLVNGTTYYYVVSAINIYGEGTNSLEVNGTPAPVPPFTPTGVTTIAGNAQVSLSWSATPGATSYNVKNATTSGGPYTTITNITATTFVDTNVINATTYYYVISAMNTYGESADSAEANVTPFDIPPLVYSVEFTGTNFAFPPLPTFANLPIIQALPDPFAWANDPLNTNGTRSVNFYDWSHHRAEIKAQIENYEIGYRPPVDPTNIFASVSGSGTTRTLTVRTTNVVNGVVRTLTQTAAISLPASSGIFPAIIGMNSANGSISLNGRAIATINFQHDQITTYGSQSDSNPYYQLYAAPYAAPAPYPSAINSTTTGQYSAWSWGCSRLIDGLYKLNGDLGGGVTINLQRIGVTGCSYAGKMALFCGAFDERIVLTIPQESGGGGAPNWRYSSTEPSGTVEWIPNTDYNWFANQLQQFNTAATVQKLPEDHHMLLAMVAPRALFANANPSGAVWLSNPSAYVSFKAVKRIYDLYGISDRFGYILNNNGQGHCVTSAPLTANLTPFLDKFLMGLTNMVTTGIEVGTNDATYINVNTARWTQWWGTTNAVLPP